ncbi:MAG: hypothetical protein RIM99_00145 [Cyclobacteriaceae bacterium]
MSKVPQNQIEDWLNKLERESWQLELLVSAFTIFLLIMGGQAFEEFMTDIQYRYNMSNGLLTFGYVFLGLLQKSLQALTYCLIGHLMLRGFWIGAIGLRSVQSSIDFSRLNYNEFFTEKLKSKVISLDQMVFRLDEICSVIFAFAFLVISMLIAFGLYLTTFGVVAIFFNSIVEVTPESFNDVIQIVAAVIFLTLFFSGLIYMTDYFTLGFFKKLRWFRKIYYPFYRFYNVITLSILSRSIYYYMISKFSKKRIRILYGIVGAILLSTILFDFDQHQYFPKTENDFGIVANFYDDVRPEQEYIDKASIVSQFIDKPYFQLFLRYDAKDNTIMKGHCPDFEPLQDDGLNWHFEASTAGGGFVITTRDYSDEDFEELLECQSAIYEVSVNDSVYQDLSYYFYVHPAKDQRGLLTTIPTDAFMEGENMLKLRKKIVQGNNPDSIGYRSMARIPFWYKGQ